MADEITRWVVRADLVLARYRLGWYLGAVAVYTAVAVRDVWESLCATGQELVVWRPTVSLRQILSTAREKANQIN